MIRKEMLPEKPHAGPAAHQARNALHVFTALDDDARIRKTSASIPKRVSALPTHTRSGDCKPQVFERITHYGCERVRVVGNPFGYWLVMQVIDGPNRGAQLTADLLEEIRFFRMKGD